MAIYGVVWDGTRNTKLIRTDSATGFTDPVPYINDDTIIPGSPFDNVAPWKNIKKSTNGCWVSIPKYWYKWSITATGNLMLQISDSYRLGYNVSPAHAARTADDTEKDTVEVARYLSPDGENNITPKSGCYPITGLSRNDMRIYTKLAGNNIYCQDYAMFWTIRMLYLVEFADWNSQKVIGIGINNPTMMLKTGGTDSIPYHTGTTAKNRAYEGYCQYRWIEGFPVGNSEYVDGIRFDGDDVYIIDDPKKFSDTTGGELVGTKTRDSGCVKEWAIPSNSKYNWALLPAAVSTKSQFTFKNIDGDPININELYNISDAELGDIWRTINDNNIINDYVCVVPHTSGSTSWRLRTPDDVASPYVEYCADHYSCCKEPSLDTNKGVVMYINPKFNGNHVGGAFFINTCHGYNDSSARRGIRLMRL